MFSLIQQTKEEAHKANTATCAQCFYRHWTLQAATGSSFLSRFQQFLRNRIFVPSLGLDFPAITRAATARDASSRGASAHGHYTVSAIFFRCHSAKLGGRSEAHRVVFAGEVLESKCDTAVSSHIQYGNSLLLDCCLSGREHVSSLK